MCLAVGLLSPIVLGVSWVLSILKIFLESFLWFSRFLFLALLLLLGAIS